jgi:hypothetical protein
MRGLGLSDGPAATGLVLGSLCLGQFSLDNNWCVADRWAPHEPLARACGKAASSAKR